MEKRVFELAKELNIPTKDLIQRIQSMGIKATNFTVLKTEQIKKIKNNSKENVQNNSISFSQKTTPEENLQSVRKVRRKRIISTKKEEKEETSQEAKPKTQKIIKKEVETKPSINLITEDKKTILNTSSEKNEPSEKTEQEPISPPNEEIIPQKLEKEKESTEKIVSKKPSSITTTTTTTTTTTKKKESISTPNKKQEVLEKDTSHEKQAKIVSKKSRKKIKDFEDDTDLLSPQIDKKKYWKNTDYLPKSKEVAHSKKSSSKVEIKPPTPQKHVFNPRKKDFVIGEAITVSELASLIGIKASEIIKTLMGLGIMSTITQTIDGETATLVASEFGINIKLSTSSLEDSIVNQEDKEEDLKPRPPVVTIMGHVDHGKTSLLDIIRKSDVISGEAGGITQHIGAYHVKSKEGNITFLDTPGHEAFTAMRARGANCTDIVILVVAADDGPKPQTVEAINHALAAKVPIIVAINKCDKPGANPQRTMQQLMEHNLVAEEFGGDVAMVEVSAKTGNRIDKLLEIVLLQAEIMELKANPTNLSQGVVIESRVDKGRGNLATFLVQSGTLKTYDYIVVGSQFGRIKAMFNDIGELITTATPSIPVEILGLNGLPNAGDKFSVGSDEKQVRQIALARAQKEREKEHAKQRKLQTENLFQSVEDSERKVLKIIVKADVAGSLEALTEALGRQGNQEVSVQVIHSSVGAISSSDIALASASTAIIFGFNVRPELTAKKMAQNDGVDIRIYSVIYDAIEDVRNLLEGMLKPIVREELQGKAIIQQIFTIPKIGHIAGSKVNEGKIIRNSYVRLLRDNIVIYDGKLSSLKRFKEDIKEVTLGSECGIGLENFKDIRTNDVIESYLRKEEAAKL